MHQTLAEMRVTVNSNKITLNGESRRNSSLFASLSLEQMI